MKEIKFKTWDKTLKKFWDTDILIDSEGVIWQRACNIADSWLEETDNFEIVWYTGLKDKNNVECYWDDIASDGINPPFVVTEDYCLLARLSEIEFEVIGNIYENPELLGSLK